MVTTEIIWAIRKEFLKPIVFELMSGFSPADKRINRLLLVLAVTAAPRRSFNYPRIKMDGRKWRTGVFWNARQRNSK